MREHTSPTEVGAKTRAAVPAAAEPSIGPAEGHRVAKESSPDAVDLTQEVRDEYRAAIAECMRRLAAAATKTAPQNVLVVGYGTGLEIRILTHLLPEAQITGVDPDPDPALSIQAHVAEQRSRRSLDLHTTTIQSYLAEHPSEQWDLVVAYFVLHLIPDVDDVIATLSAHLKPNGSLITADWQSPDVVPLARQVNVLECELIEFEMFNPIQPHTRGVCWRTSRRNRE